MGPFIAGLKEMIMVCLVFDPFRSISKAALVLALLLGASSPFGAANETVASRIEAIFAPIANATTPGTAVLVRKDGRIVFLRGYGVRDLRTFTPIDAQTDFRLASFSKQFTALATMLLVNDGKLRYDERLMQIFPDLPAYAGTTTIRDLLTHTSGLPDYEDLMEAAEKTKGPVWTASHQIQDEEVLELLKQRTIGKFRPGTSWDYSNTGYVLLGLVVAKVSGESFAQFLHDRIFRPLHMDDTLAFVSGKNTVPSRAYGYTKEGDNFVETDQSPTSATLGDGGIYSNLADLAKWDQALQDHTLLNQQEMNAGVTPVQLADGSEPRWPAQPSGDNLDPGKPVSYGFGWFLDSYHGHRRMWHSGTTVGFRTVIERFPQDKLTVVVLCNRTDLDATSLALQTAEIFF